MVEPGFRKGIAAAAGGVPAVQVIPGTGGNWLTAALRSALPASSPAVVQPLVDAAVVTGLAYGTYTSYAVVTMAAGQRVLTVRLLVNAVAVTRVVDSAGYQARGIAPEALLTVFGINEATKTVDSSSAPQTALGGTSVSITDGAGVARVARLLYASPGQVNLLAPAGMASGAGTLTIVNGANQQATQVVAIGAVAPGLFTAEMSGQGVAAAVVQRVAADGTQSSAAAASCGVGGVCAAVPIDVTGGQTYLSLYGTGIRGRPALSQVVVTVGGVAAPVLYGGDQVQYAGVDQINVQLPASLAGRGDVSVVATVDGVAANVVRITVR